MNAALRKEIRLLLPALVAALLAATIPIWIIGWDDHATRGFSFVFLSEGPGSFAFSLLIEGPGSLALALLIGGILLLSLSSFGLEMSLGTFSSLLAQPRPREETWRMKIGLLAAAVAAVMVAACLSWCLRISIMFDNISLSLPVSLFLIHSILLVSVVALASGLWTTMLFRQVAVSFWVSILLPLVLFTVSSPLIDLFSEEDDISFEMAALAFAACGYAAVGYGLARWLFFHAQDNQAQEATDAGGWAFLPAFPKPRWAMTALLVKELRLQQGTLLIGAVLLLLNLSAVAVAVYWPALATKYPSLREVWMLWVLMPLVLGCISVAEERRCCTLDGALCLPTRRLLQFAIKLMAVFALGILLGALMPWLLEQLRMQVLAHTQRLEVQDLPGFVRVVIIITAISCYASSLSGKLLQALGTAVLLGLILPLIILTLGDSLQHQWQAVTQTGHMPWWVFILGGRQYIPRSVLIGVLIGVFLFLTYSNFKQLRITWRIWLRNAIILLAAYFLMLSLRWVLGAIEFVRYEGL
jgi:hypothetical protein